MRRKIVAIINPASGRRDMSPLVEQIALIVRCAGGRMEILRTERAGHATELAAALDQDVDAILAVGGDGTVYEIFNGLDGGDIPIAILRTGTENLLARELNMPTDAISMARLLMNGQAVAHDVGTVNGRRFLAVAGVGFDGLCVHRMDAVRRGHISHLSYAAPIWQSFWEYEFPCFTVQVDGDLIFEGRGFAMLGIIPRYSVGLRILDRAVRDDGLLDVCIFPCEGRLGLLGHSVRVFAGTHIGHGGVVYRQGRVIDFQADTAIPMQIDGDPGGFAPARFSVESSGACFLVENVTDGNRPLLDVGDWRSENH